MRWSSDGCLWVLMVVVCVLTGSDWKRVNMFDVAVEFSLV